MFCKNCGKEIGDNLAFCPECGSSTGASASAGYEDGKVASTSLEDGKIVVPPVVTRKAPPQQPVKAKNSSKKFIILLAISILIVAILVVVIVMMSSKLNEKENNKSGNTTNALEVLSQQNYDDDGNKEPVVEVTTAEVTDLNVETTTKIEAVTEVVTDKSGEKVTEIVTQKPVEATTKPSATQPPVTQPPASNKPSTKAEIVAYFNKVINGVKPGAKAVVQHGVVNYLATVDGPTVIPGGIKGIYNTLGGDKWLDGMLQDNSLGEATLTGSAIKANFPVEGMSWSSKLSASDVSSATCTEKDGIYTITIKTVADSKSSSVVYGQGHNPKVFSVALPGVINENIPGIAKGMVGDASLGYPSSTVTIRVSAKTEKVLSAEYDAHWTIYFDKMGIVLPFATKSTYTIKW